MASTCTAAISAVDQAFRSNRRRPPGRDETRKLHFFLSRQLRGYANLDPATKGQKALTPRLLRAMAQINDGAEAIATHHLLRGAFFFGMRFCEYLEVQGPRRTKRLCLKNIRFFIKNDKSSRI
jgi:hypothetical protein